MVKTQLESDLKKTISDLGYSVADIVCDIPKNPAFGDYTTNIALQLAKQEVGNGKQNPLDIANQISSWFMVHGSSKDYLDKVEVAGGGFINFYLNTEALMKNIHLVCNYSLFVNPQIDLEGEEKKKILVEYASFNALKPIHVGHLRNITLGESITRLLESVGNEVYRVTYTSDIGLPSAKVVWAALKSPEAFRKAEKSDLNEKISFLGKLYVKGNKYYEEEKESKEEIDEINTKIYQGNPDLVKVWKEVLSWTFEYFAKVYQLVGTKFDAEFLESEAAVIGLPIVRDNIGKVFKEDQGAVIFPGEEFGLHNRVFISSLGNPTYEAKDMGLAKLQYQKFPFDLAIHVVARDQEEYFRVIFKALDLLDHDLGNKERHLSYGYVILTSGKMSSRKGNVVTLEEVLKLVKEKVEEIMKDHKELNGEEKQQVIDTISIGAMKFSILKYGSQTDVTFDIGKSVSLEGDSGPYIQYTYARAKSVLRNANYNYQPEIVAGELELEERRLLHKIEVFQTVVSDAARDFNPTSLTSFLLEVAKTFNLFYQKHQIIKANEKAEFRLALTCAVAVILKQGLYLLGIEAPERM